MDPDRVQPLIDETVEVLRNRGMTRIWDGKFPSVALQVREWDEGAQRSFLAGLARQSWPDRYLCHVLWSYITPFKKNGETRVRPIDSAPSISSEYSERILRAMLGLGSDDDLRGDEGFQKQKEIVERCNLILTQGEEFLGPGELFDRIYTEFPFVQADWNCNISADGGRPRLERTVINAVRKAVGRQALHQGKKLDPALDESWEEMFAVEKRGRKILYRYIGKGRVSDPVEAALEAEVEDDDGSGHVYAIVNEAWPGWVKIGMSVDWERRLDSYQTSSPHRDYRVLGVTRRISDRHRAEARTHVIAEETAAERSGEWFRITDREARESLKRTENEQPL